MSYKKRQKKCIHHFNEHKSILLDQTQKSSFDKCSKPWIEDLRLSNSDYDILLSPTSWLMDLMIDARQTMLKKCNSTVPWLESVVCALTLTHFVQHGEFV